MILHLGFEGLQRYRCHSSQFFIRNPRGGLGLVVEMVGVSGSMADLAKIETVRVDKEEEGQRLIEGASIVDFDVLCSNVALQNQGKWRLLDNEKGEEEGVGSGGVFRMWEGEVLDCFDDRRIAVESLWLDLFSFPL